MRFLDNESDRPCSQITCYLTRVEAEELRGALEAILERHSHHEHVSSKDYSKELTVCVYDLGDLSQFDERSRRLLREDA